MTLTPKWVNTEVDEGALPALLDRMAALLPPETLDELWIFPTRRTASVESTVVVATTFADDAERRHVFTAHFTVMRDRKGKATVEQQLHEHALAPSAALERVMEGVTRRLGDDAIQPPRTDRIDGDPERWRALIQELGGTPATAVVEPTAASEESSQAESRP
jgi:hypothetical protein